MPTFQYKALDETGKSVSGSIEASDRKHAVLALKKKKCKPVRLKMTSGSNTAAVKNEVSMGDVDTSNTKKPSRFRASRSPDKLTVAFLSKVLQLHRSGMPIGDVIKSLSMRLTDPELKELSNSLWSHISEGKTLAVAMRHNPDVFDNSASYLIEAGEATGNLIPVLEDIIKQAETRISLRKKIIEGVTYPAILCLMAMSVVALMLFFLVPKIEGMISKISPDGELPWAVKLINGFSDFMLTQGPFIAAGLIIVLISVIRWRRTDAGRMATDQWLLRAPLVKGIVLNLDLCRICNMLPTLLASGVNATEALRLTGKIIQNKSIEARYNAARTMINDGATYLTSFKKYKIFSDIDLDILGVGENTGSPVDSLREIFEQHNSELDRQFKLLTAVVAFGALGFAFLLIALVVFSIVMSVLGMTKSIMG